MIDVNNLESGEYDNVKHVRLFGGDGTVNNFINNHDVSSISLHKFGSGNDLYRSIERKTFTYTYNANDYKFINGFGYGIDSYVCEQAEKTKAKSYFYILLKSVKNFKKFDLTLKIDNSVHSFSDCFCVCACNGTYFGGGVAIAPKANLSSEELDVIVVHNLKGLKIVLFLFLLLIKKHYLIKSSVFYQKSSNIIIYNNNDIVYQIDGELKHTSTDINISVNSPIIINKSRKSF